jgi:SP family sugar:H+ symporter-like MFS transporter
MLNRFMHKGRDSRESSEATARPSRDATDPTEVKGDDLSDEPVKLLRFRVIIMGALVSLGGFIFGKQEYKMCQKARRLIVYTTGFDTGQISGFVAMRDFLDRFADQPGPAFSNGREGTIVGLLSIGTLLGVLIAGPIADKLGRKLAIVTWCAVFIVGITIQIATFTSWVQFAIGRLIAGFGVGGLSVMTPVSGSFSWFHDPSVLTSLS